MMTLAEAADIYQQSANVIFTSYRVSHPQFREFSVGLQNLIRNLGEDIEIDDWQNFTRRLKRYRFEQLAAPLGFGNPAAMSADDLAKLEEYLHRLQFSSPILAPDGISLLDSLRQLIRQNDNPAVIKFCEIVSHTGFVPIVVLESRLIKPTEEVFENLAKKRGVLNRFYVIGERQLRGNECFEEIVCFGASRWYSDFVFDASRAAKIHLLHFDWMRETGLARTAGFIKPLKNQGDNDKQQQNFMQIAAADEQTIESDEVTPTINLTQIAERYAKRISQNHADDEFGETTEARLFRLEGRSGVFLEEHSRILAIDFETELTVLKTPVTAITPGMFVLLRDGRGGDLIVSIANKIMGKQSTNLRQFQSDWKRHLQAFVRRFGNRKTIEKLKSNGAVHATEINLRNWLSSNNIETRDPHDFIAMMRLCGYESALEDCQKAAKIIRQAHQKAGTRVRRLLLEQVAAADLTELEKLGEMRFEIAKSGGNLIAVRVVSRAANVVEIETKQLNRRFALER